MRRNLVARLATALVQALALYLLAAVSGETPSWPATEPELFAPLLLVACFVPLLVLAGLGRMPGRALTVWAVAAAVVIAGLGWHDGAREAMLVVGGHDTPSLHRIILFVVLAGWLFIAHVLVVDAVAERRLFPPMPGTLTPPRSWPCRQCWPARSSACSGRC
jgi:hypothetical protein